uniref:Secreted protein n=1 Tax=Helianthus annuus TaxID=4232 RepID=A0A251TNL1_HELAN
MTKLWARQVCVAFRYMIFLQTGLGQRVHAILGANLVGNGTDIWNTYQLLTGQGKCFWHLIVVCRNIDLLFAGSCTCIRRTSCGLM